MAQANMDDMLLQPQADGATLASKFSCLLLDNASIHKDVQYTHKLKTHIQVKFIPPYCYHLTPLDNGAYGLVVRFLQSHPEYAQRPIQDGLSAAFHSVSGEAARWCFPPCEKNRGWGRIRSRVKSLDSVA